MRDVDCYRELHDEIAQTLAGINVQLAALSLEAAASARGLRSRIASTQRQVGRSIEAIHRFARELRPALLDDLGLIPALRSFLKKFAARTGLRIRFTAFAGVEALDNARRTVLYRVAQEALTNVSRHAQAGFVQVSVRKIPNAVCLEVADDGRSFQVQRVLSSRANKRLGLLGMRERVEMVGGSLAIASMPGRGTTIRARLRAFGIRLSPRPTFSLIRRASITASVCLLVATMPSIFKLATILSGTRASRRRASSSGENGRKAEMRSIAAETCDRSSWLGPEVGDLAWVLEFDHERL